MKANYLRYPLILFIIGGFCATAISAVNYITTPILQRNEELLLEESLASLYDNIDSFEIYQTKEQINQEPIVNIFHLNLSDSQKAIVYQTDITGMQGQIVSLIAFKNNELDKIVNISHNETPNIGSRIDDLEYLDSITSQSIANIEIATISGATGSSRALKNAVTASIEHFQGGLQ